MNITQEEVLKIASMSRVAIRQDEIETLRRQLEEVLQYAAMVQEFPKSDSDFVSSKNVNVTREDSARQFEVQTIMERAPEHESGYFVVPRIIEK